jgi:RP/EB family microtubule-associated protein
MMLQDAVLNVVQVLKVKSCNFQVTKFLFLVPRKSSSSAAAPLRREPSFSRPVVPKEVSARPSQSSIPATAPQPYSQPQTTNVNNVQLAALTKTITELKLSVDEMEKERDFYFSKLRDIEILTQKVTEPVITQSAFFKQVTEILYTTEEGFEIPAESIESASVKVL